MAFFHWRDGQDAERERQRLRRDHLPPGARARVERERREAEEARRRAQADAEDEWDDGDEDEFADDTPSDELLDVVETIERHRAELNAAATYFAAILADEPDLRRQWQEFTRCGGVSAHDFRRFLDGQVIRYRPTRHRKHLRLVVNQRKPTALRRPRGQGDDAA